MKRGIWKPLLTPHTLVLPSEVIKAFMKGSELAIEESNKENEYNLPENALEKYDRRKREKKEKIIQKIEADLSQE